jgi:all-trans-8'-apo-beta-carotenal 15,15'-oxygenase
LERAFELEVREDSYVIDDIDGRIPDFVRGSYYVNGPGRFRRGEQRYGHWLDGDGMVAALHFEPGLGGRGLVAEWVQRFVRSHKWTAEEEAGKALFRTFGTSFADDQLVRGIALASPVNVSAYHFAGQLLAFGEQGLPFALDPRSLETLGEHTFGRRLNAISPFSAHPNVDPVSGELFNFGVSFSARSPLIHFYRFNAAGELLERRRRPLERPVSIHDFALAPNHLVVHASPYVLDMDALAAGRATLMQALKWRPELGSQLLLEPRHGGGEMLRLDVGCGYCLHLIGAFEDAGHLVVDLIELSQPVYDQYELPQLFPAVRPAQPVRYVIDTEAAKVVERRVIDDHRMCDFPAIDPRRAGRDYRDFWVLALSASDRPGRKFFDQVVRFDWQEGRAASVWTAPKLCYLGGEPVMIPDPSKDRGGVVICQQFDAQEQRSSMLLFDALDLAAGPVARLRLRHPVPLGFHASFHGMRAFTARQLPRHTSFHGTPS